ncbi:MAG: phospho-sugar mutase [Lachnospiraceae bacterium]|nr:phospho-sugar mutase [Lachnospiraceae bacterium]MEE3460849.1 phospho-sugar mutase [Lachnospiraceae bacterium]
MDYKDSYNEWLTDPYFDEETKKELKSIADDDNEIKERFYKELEFGTAGLRGIIGAGTNRMNIYTVRKATQGLADYINSQGKADMGVVIGYDSRHMSPEFADESALCLIANGIKAYVFESLRPTPEISYALRKLHAAAAINITASHNPAKYNGYKVYWEDGAQITPPHDTGIMDCVKNVKDWASVKTTDKESAVKNGMYIQIGKDIDDPYIEELKKNVIHMDSIKEMGDKLKIVYTPLHGTGNIPVRRVLEELGFKHVTVVPEQEKPDGDFPTVDYPNPENKAAFKLALDIAKEQDADIALATDPDADRLGVYVKDTASGEYIPLTGNMSGSLLAEYELSQMKARDGKLPADGKLIKTIVTSNLADAVAENYGVDVIEVLTGFKYIGQQILKFETTGKGTYLFGFEESYGCLIGTHARDKDAVDATMALCEAAAYYMTKGLTLWDVMMDMYKRYGFYQDGVQSVTMEGIEGLAKIGRIMDELRSNPPKEFCGHKVLSFRDYENDKILDTATGDVKPTGLPKSNVLYFDMSDKVWMCVRPSGTEPKIKFYYGIVGGSMEDADKKSKAMADAVNDLVHSF